MHVFLVRHAIAVPRDALGGFDDASRALTDRGIRRMEKHVQALERLGVVLDEIWTSPLVRARQTAEILATMDSFDGEVRTVDALQPGSHFRALADELAGGRADDAVALVGHEPDMGSFATWLMCGQAGSAMVFKKGGVACLEVDQTSVPIQGQLLWFLTPGQMRLFA